MWRNADLIKLVGAVRKPVQPGMIALLLLIILSFSRCQPLAKITINVLEPGELILPAHVEKLAFINRSHIPEMLDWDTVIWSQEELFILDTIISYRSFLGMADALNASPLFDLGKISVIQLRRTDTTNSMKPLTSQELKSIGTTLNADAIFSLESYKISAEQEFGFSDTYFSATLTFKSDTYWRIYNYFGDTILDEYMLSDSVVWVEFGESPEEAFGNLPLATDALRETGYHAGFMYGTRISPSWMEQDRYYYRKGSQSLIDAATLVDYGQWDRAQILWRKAANAKEMKKAARACFNMALAMEMEDSLKQALVWARRSYLLMEDDLTFEYIELLEERLQKMERLNLQLPS
jgi:hypothetical protein